ncbi:HlyD family efflux transporter periplasmic adaptor subunit [Listeria rocourtiae]|uniref:HlyD family efflux transporter periplasmic adaptor subunit n=1 Tax=Listeria rocourtiae TaxID=647910 RepID=UPI00162762F5|nr:HlyD family efflux transporter periplasmic adaptor subunit [Listeria rocourtiae]MBC1605339.1 HlyD family efflux transporter periplasmic adaptor subunit [Listeria rocourtiae]
MNNKRLEEIKVDKRLYERKYSKTGLFVAYPMIVLLLSLVIFLAFTQKEVTIKSQGSIEKPNSAIVLKSFVSTEITKIEIMNSKSIKKGNTVIEFNSDEIDRKLESAEKAKITADSKMEYIKKFRKSIQDNTNYLTNNRFGFYNKYEAYREEINKLNNTIATQEESQSKAKDVETKKKASINVQIEENKKILEDYKIFQRYVNDGTGEIGKVKSEVVRNEIAEYKENIKASELADKVENTTSQSDRYKMESNSKISQKIESIEEKQVQLEQALIAAEEANTSVTLNGEIESNNIAKKTLREQNLVEAETLISDLEKELEEIKINQELYRVEKERYTISAPVDGIVEFTNSWKIGDTIPVGNEVARVVQDDSAKNYIKSYISSDKIYALKEGQDIRFQVNQASKKNRIIKGRIKSVSKEPTVTEEGTYFLVESSIAESANSINGLTGTMYIVTEKVSYMRFLWNKFIN